MKHQIRNLVLTIIFSMAALIAAAQTTTHVVQRGESIESIAEKYGITTEALLKANPDAADFFFVGMKLQIPAGEAATVKTQTATTSTPNTTNQTNAESTSQLATNEKTKSSPLKVKVVGGLTMAKWGGNDMNSDNKDANGIGTTVKTKNIFNYHIGLIGSYYFKENVFVSLGGIFNVKGYKQSGSGGFWDDEGLNYDAQITKILKSKNIDVLLHFGGDIVFNDIVSLKLHGGPFVTFNIGGEQTSKGQTTINSGETEHSNDNTKIGKGELNTYRKTEFGLSCGIDIQVSHFMLGFTYEGGLTQMLKKKGMYDQSMLFSVGYEF